MATVIFSRFNDEQGAIVSDESTWHLGFKYGYRRANYGDSIFNLLDNKKHKNLNMSVIYAGEGFPSFHYEVARKSREFVNENVHNYKTVEDITEKIHEIYTVVHKRYLDDRLKFTFGFDSDQLNALAFKKNDKEYEIKQDKIISEAKKVIKNQDKSPGSTRLFENNGVVIGYDETNGLTGYWMDKDRSTMDFALNFGVIGSGNQIVAHVFNNSISKMNLTERRNGMNMMDGLYLLLCASVETKNIQSKMGGYFQITIIDGTREVIKKLTKENTSHNAHLMSEIIQANLWGFIDRDITYEFMEQLLFKDADYKVIEKEFFDKASDVDTLKKYLMGYKAVNVRSKII